MPKKTSIETLIGYAELRLARAVGKTASVKVRELPIRAFAEYAANIEDEPALVSMFTGLTAAEVDALDRGDFVKILKKGNELNFDPFLDWLKRKVEARKTTLQVYGIQTNTPTSADESPTSSSERPSAGTPS